MKTVFQTIFLVIAISILNSCTDKPKIEGLWQVEKVEVGKEEMTPVARWVRFNADFSQEAGNGWLQHSIGTYDFNLSSNQLSIENTNGFEDTNEPFSVRLEDEKMQWSRQEEGQNVIVHLKRADKLPMSPGNQLMGVWQLKKVTKDDQDISTTMNPDGKRFLFLKWDRLFNIQNTPEGRLSGVYRIHGHKSKLELTYFGDDCIREYWDFEISDTTLKLISVNTTAEIVKEYERIRTFLN